MDRLRFTLIAVFILGLLGVSNAGAQTAAQILIVGGNGQVACLGCSPRTAFSPLLVRVVDASGNGIPNKLVTWTVLSTQGYQPILGASTTYTDAKGYAWTTFSQNGGAGNPASPYFRSVVQASADAVSVNFYETMNLIWGGIRMVSASVLTPGQGVNLEGNAGGTSPAAIQIRVNALGIPVSNVSVRILNSGDPATSPSASCATGASADAGSVLTDANGNATCNVVFGPVPGNGLINVIVGGTDPSVAPDYYTTWGITTTTYFWASYSIPITVQTPTPGLLSVSSGNNQNLNPGQASSPLVVKVTDAGGTTPINGANVMWSATPSNAAMFSKTTSFSDAQGLASTVVTLTPAATGTVTIKASLTGTYSNIATTFTLGANVVLSALQKVSGDPQTAATGQAFSQPLIVQVNGTNGLPLSNQPVAFAVSGPAVLSANTVTTDSSGRAQVTVTAGSTAGAVTVIASAGGHSVSFGLTVIPPGPVLTSGGFVNGADFQTGALSPCSIATIIGSGIAPNLQGVAVPGNIVGPLPYTLANVKVDFGGSQAPIYNVANVNGQQQVTVEVPCDVTPGNVPVTVNVGGASSTITVPILPASPGVFLTQMSDGVSRVVAVRPDGTFVRLDNPARRNEVITVYVTGLGSVAPPVATNSVPAPGVDSNVLGQVIVGVNNAGTRLVGARVAPGMIGVYEVTFQVPNDAPSGNDVIFSVGINAVGDTQTRFSAGTRIPIQ